MKYKYIKETFLGNIPLLIFDSDKWKSNEEYADVYDEIIRYMKAMPHEQILVQNKGYCFGDTMSNPIFKIKISDYGGFEGTLELFIKDLVYDLIPE